MSNSNQTTEALDISAIPALSEPLFKDVVTLDPSEVEAKWDLLSTDILPLQLANLNKIVLLALAATLKERKLFDDGPKPEKTNPAQSTKTPEPEILPPNEKERPVDITIQTIIQNIDRPEELFKVFEEHSPGFIESTRKQVEMFFEKSMESRFKFSERQAYTALCLRVFAAIAIFMLAGVAIFKGSNFLTLLALVIFYAVAEGGTQIWRKIGTAIAEYISKK